MNFGHTPYDTVPIY
jgi:hypothetical protein